MNDTTLDTILNRINRSIIDDCAEKVIKAEQVANYAAYMARRGYKHTRVTLQAVEAYLKGYNILLSGNVGTGKTFFFQCINPKIRVLDMNEAYLWKYDDLVDWLIDTNNEDVLVDDIGAGATASKNYGVAYDALMVVLQRRMSRSRAHTHFTTNLDNDGLIKTFDYRIVDRIYQLARPFVMDRRESMRQARPIPTTTK